jgi:hypothetical protein
MSKKMIDFLKCFYLPFSMAVFLPLFHYGNNAALLLLPSLVRMILLSVILSAVLYAIFWAITRKPFEAANATFVFLIFFHTYGMVYDYFLTFNNELVRHRVIFPLFMLSALAAAWFVSRIKTSSSIAVWKNLNFIVSALIVFNIVRIIPVEAKKIARSTPTEVVVTSSSSQIQEYPDIYFIVLDEFSGFEPMREYWKNPRVDDFADFLTSNGFFVAEQSNSSSIKTLHQMATRLNYEEYPCCEGKYNELYYEKISDNRVMKYLKSRGYSTVAIEELTEFIDAATPVGADHTFNYNSNAAEGAFILFDEFGRLVAANSMLRVFPPIYNQGEDLARVEHRKFIFTTINRVAELEEIPSPKFVYVHLVFPHKPFMFDENGKSIPKRYQSNWNYYLGQYNYSLDLTREMVENILSESDPNRPPVIILQSDHGARNLKNASTTIILDDFSEEYKTNIMFALYMPGHDLSELPQDVYPTNTFPIVFNYLFDDHIPLLNDTSYLP